VALLPRSTEIQPFVAKILPPGMVSYRSEIITVFQGRENK